MACNTPIIASFDKNSEMDHVLSKSKSGVCVEPENLDLLKKMILDLKNKKEKYCQLNGGREYVTANASKDNCVSEYISILTGDQS